METFSNFRSMPLKNVLLLAKLVLHAKKYRFFGIFLYLSTVGRKYWIFDLDGFNRDIMRKSFFGWFLSLFAVRLNRNQKEKIFFETELVFKPEKSCTKYALIWPVYYTHQLSLISGPKPNLRCILISPRLSYSWYYVIFMKSKKEGKIPSSVFVYYFKSSSFLFTSSNLSIIFKR